MWMTSLLQGVDGTADVDESPYGSAVRVVRAANGGVVANKLQVQRAREV